MGTHPIFESDFDCLTECPPETLKLATQPQPSTAKLWLMASSKMSALINSRPNMLSSSFTHLTSLSSAQLKLLPFQKPMDASKKMKALPSVVFILLMEKVFFVKSQSTIYQLVDLLKKHSDWFKLSNSLMNMEKFVQLDGSQARIQ